MVLILNTVHVDVKHWSLLHWKQTDWWRDGLMMAGPLYEIKPLQKQLFLIVKLFESDCYNIAFLTAERSISFYNF